MRIKLIWCHSHAALPYRRRRQPGQSGRRPPRAVAPLQASVGFNGQKPGCAEHAPRPDTRIP
jgi:hypothetical protein